MVFSVDVLSESIQETGGAVTADNQMASMAATRLFGVAMCDVDAPHQSYISDDEDYRFQMPVAVFGHDQGRHAGGKAYEWGSVVLQLKRGLHMRLVNVGAAGRVKSQGLLGYPLCLVCGHSRSPNSSQKELDDFSSHHIERCGRPIEYVGFYAEVVSDALVLPDCDSKQVAYSILEALRQGAADVLDMEISDLQVLVFGKSGTESVDALLYDPMPGGSGLLEQLIKHWSKVVLAARRIVEDCAAACEISCIDCLQHFRNAFYHENLNRHLALEYFKEWGDTLSHSHDIPPILPDETQTLEPVNDPEAQLGAMLKAAGLPNYETERPITLSGGVITRPDIYFHQPNDQYAGVCVYLDGMSGHLHGNVQTAANDRQIRQELLNTDYEVVEIKYQDLFLYNHVRGDSLNRILLSTGFQETSFLMHYLFSLFLHLLQ